MKKILCPVDFSEAAQTGVEYASNLAKALSARLTLFYVRPTIWPEAIQLEQEVAESMEKIGERLQIFSSVAHDEFGITCDYHILQTTDTVEMAIATKANEYDLIAMGTNGADNLYEHVFGSHTFHLIEKTKCPVVIVPEGYVYQPLKSVVYAYDPEKNAIFLVDQLKQFATDLNLSIRVLHVSPEKHSPETERKLKVIEEALNARVSKDIAWSFDFTYSDKVAWSLDEYIKKNHAEILAVSFHHRSGMDMLLRENVVKEITMIATYPVFVFWH